MERGFQSLSDGWGNSGHYTETHEVMIFSKVFATGNSNSIRVCYTETHWLLLYWLEFVCAHMFFCEEMVCSSPVATFRNVFPLLPSAYIRALYIVPTWHQEHQRGKHSAGFLCSVNRPAQRRQAVTCVMRQFGPTHLLGKAKNYTYQTQYSSKFSWHI